MQDGGNDAPANHQHQSRKDRQLAEGQAQAFRQFQRLDVAAFQNRRHRRQDHQHQHGEQVLHHQPADGDMAAAGVGQAAVLQCPHHHHSGSHRQAQAEHQALCRRPAERHAGAHPQRGDRRHLQHRTRHHNGFHFQQLAGLEVQPNAEHQQHHADIGQLQGQVLVQDYARTERSNHHARQQVAQQRRQAQPLHRRTQHKGQAQADDQDADQRGHMLHVPTIAPCFRSGIPRAWENNLRCASEDKAAWKPNRLHPGTTHRPDP